MTARVEPAVSGALRYMCVDIDVNPVASLFPGSRERGMAISKANESVADCVITRECACRHVLSAKPSPSLALGLAMGRWHLPVDGKNGAVWQVLVGAPAKHPRGPRKLSVPLQHWLHLYSNSDTPHELALCQHTHVARA